MVFKYQKSSNQIICEKIAHYKVMDDILSKQKTNKSPVWICLDPSSQDQQNAKNLGLQQPKKTRPKSRQIKHRTNQQSPTYQTQNRILFDKEVVQIDKIQVKDIKESQNENYKTKKKIKLKYQHKKRIRRQKYHSRRNVCKANQNMMPPFMIFCPNIKVTLEKQKSSQVIHQGYSVSQVLPTNTNLDLIDYRRQQLQQKQEIKDDTQTINHISGQKPSQIKINLKKPVSQLPSNLRFSKQFIQKKYQYMINNFRTQRICNDKFEIIHSSDVNKVSVIQLESSSGQQHLIIEKQKQMFKNEENTKIKLSGEILSLKTNEVLTGKDTTTLMKQSQNFKKQNKLTNQQFIKSKLKRKFTKKAIFQQDCQYPFDLQQRHLQKKQNIMTHKLRFISSIQNYKNSFSSSFYCALLFENQLNRLSPPQDKKSTFLNETQTEPSPKLVELDKVRLLYPQKLLEFYELAAKASENKQINNTDKLKLSQKAQDRIRYLYK